MRLLLVEDEPQLAGHLQRGLREEGYAVDVAHDGAGGAELLAGVDYDLLVLDLMLPGRSGLELLAEQRALGSTVPVLVLTARDTVADKVAGLDAGADDYLTKPFAFSELLARIRSLLRRRERVPATLLRVDDLELDRDRRRAARSGHLLPLTSRELALLEYLMLHAGAALSRERIAEHVWDRGYESRSNVIDVIVGRLRRKLEEGGGSRLIHTVKGVGYSLRSEAAE